MSGFKALGKTPPEDTGGSSAIVHFRLALLEAADFIERFGGEKVMRINEQVKLWRMLRLSAGEKEDLK